MAAVSIDAGLPGSDLIAQGVQDLAEGRETVEALLVSIGAPRLRAAGVPVAEPIASRIERLMRALGSG